jgi:hypothetical protein
MVRQKFQRLSSGDIDEVWSRMRAGLAAKPTARSLGSRRARSGTTCCAAAGSAPVHDTGQQDG